jgi:hypothetical protein
MHACQGLRYDRKGRNAQRWRWHRCSPHPLAIISAFTSCSITVITRMSDIKFILLTSSLQGRTNRRDLELLQLDARSHAAKVSHASRKRKSLRQAYGQSRPGSGAPRTSCQAGAPVQYGDLKSAILPHPQSLLGQGKVDPFRSKHFTELPPAMIDGLEYVYEVLWPNTSPALQGQALREAISTWRRDGCESALIYYSQVANVATLCHGLARDPSIQKMLLTVRLQRE